MNDDEGIIEGEEGAAGAPEGAPVAEPTTDDVAEMYKELGVKAPAPTGAVKGRPKSTKVRAKDVSDDDDDDSKSGRKDEKPGKDKSKDAPASDEDGDSGDSPDSKGKKVGKDSAEVPDEPEGTDTGVRDAKSKSKEDSERGSKEDTDEGAESTGQNEEEQKDSENEEGKRPGKSDPKVERRFQKLTTDVRERDQVISELQEKLHQAVQQQTQQQVQHEDPEYTIDDFRRVRDEDGNIVDLDNDQAELAHRRWKDGFDQRSTEREAKNQHELSLAQQESETSERIMRSSVEAYDTLASLMDDYPELVSTSGKFDANFAAQAMPVIQEAIVYQPGTEPGNPDNNQAVILGMRLNPKTLLNAMKSINSAKRSLPVNGVNDNVDVRSNVSVPHGRSSDSTVNAANELYKELKIDKRF